MKHLFILLLFGASCLFAQGQEKKSDFEATKPGTQLPIEEAKPIDEVSETVLLNQELRVEIEALKRTLNKEVTIEVIDLAQERAQKESLNVSPPETVEAMIKVVLGDVYTEVGHIPEPQWFEMEPIAEEYVNALFEARTTADDAAAMQIHNQARAKYEAAIDAKLTAQQKATRVQKRAETEAWIQEKANISAQAEDLIRSASTKTASKTNSQKATRITFQ